MPPSPCPAVRIYAYSGCDTCRKALKFLAARGVAHEVLAIRETPPTVAELRQALTTTGGDIRRLFNTSGQDYRVLGLGKKLDQMSLPDALELLASNGNLVKRPLLLAGKQGLIGFRETEWEALFPEHPAR